MSRVSEFEDLPEAMVLYLAARLTKVSKHAGGHTGQKFRARARRRGAWGKVVRRRQLARQRLALTSRVQVADAAFFAAHPKLSHVTYDEAVPFVFEGELDAIRWQEAQMGQ